LTESQPPESEERAAALATRTSGASEPLQIVIVFLIAVSAILGAGATWGAVRSAIQADERDRAGFEQQGNAVDLDARVRQEHDASVQAYVAWLAHSTFARALRDEAAHARPLEASRLRLEASAEDRSAKAAWRRVGRAAGSAPGQLDLERGDREVRLEEQLKGHVDVDPGDDRALADGLRTKAENLVLAGAMLIVAAVAFTLARVRRRSDYQLWFTIGGVLLIVWFTVGLYWEVGT
jgi:hypothetical protein